ncbi:MAG TPA: zf-HC2 domain-containing protein [Candidatus Acidoferrum sp.]|nr:zf-HC2 domain-containing protein [Candidatus Acidoferrum sp.]
MSDLDKTGRASEYEERFSDLCALAHSGSLSHEEMTQLEEHLKTCSDCREADQDYSILTNEGMLSLAAECTTRQTDMDRVSDELVTATERRVFDRLPALNPATKAVRMRQHVPEMGPRVSPPVSRRILALAAAVVLVAGLSGISYRLGQSGDRVQELPPRIADPRVASLSSEKMIAENLATSQERELDRLHKGAEEQAKQLAKLRGQLTSTESDLHRAVEDQSATEVKLREQRDGFAEQIRQKEQAYDQAQAELTRLRSERDKTLLQLASLKQEVDSLSAERTEESHRAKEAEGFLSADRDIRELMGARQLYIADVFDVSSDSRTRKPYGRVFYTKGKSLIFYAFDLDRQADFKNASTFQVWGKNESAQDRPVNLGVLYVDSEANRRWALRCDDPQQLAEIDALFVTVEPNAHGRKPTGKPFLYASLRKAPNHP